MINESLLIHHSIFTKDSKLENKHVAEDRLMRIYKFAKF